MKKAKNRDFINDKLLKRVMIPLNVLFIIASCGYSIHSDTKNTEIYYSISSDIPFAEGPIELTGHSKISGKTVAKKIEDADKENVKENVYAFRLKKDGLSFYEPIYVSTSGEPTYVQMVNRGDFFGFGYGKIMNKGTWYDDSEFEKENTYVDPISTEELENNYNFYLEKEGISDNTVNSYGKRYVYVMQKKY